MNAVMFATTQLMDCPKGCNTYMLWFQNGQFVCPHCKARYQVVCELKEVGNERETSPESG